MQVTLEELTIDNWEACTNLSLVDDQKDNLPANIYSIAELQFYPQSHGVAIVADDSVIGFATYGIPVGERVGKIFRLMIDEKYQKKGYGTQALKKMIELLFENKNINEIQVCYNPTKPEIKKFYASVGFVEDKILPSKRRAEGRMQAILKRN